MEQIQMRSKATNVKERISFETFLHSIYLPLSRQPTDTQIHTHTFPMWAIRHDISDRSSCCSATC